MRVRSIRLAFCTLVLSAAACCATTRADHVKELQTKAIHTGTAEWGQWGIKGHDYTGWKTHSNRLIPIYTFGITLDELRGTHSPYRVEARLRELFGQVPEGTLNPQAEYFDQTDVYRLQQQAARQGKKRIILFIFDGTDWQTTWAAATYKSGKVKYRSGRGTGLAFQDYRGTTTDFGYFVTSPYCEASKCDVNAQTIVAPGVIRGGYNWKIAGQFPWSVAAEPPYLISQCRVCTQAYTDSAASATSMTCGIKTYNDAINVDHEGRQVEPIARKLQRDGWGVGVVTSVPISHATPACAYANNVHRDDYQDLTRDLVGLPSVAHKKPPLAGVDVLIGGGYGDEISSATTQGANYIAGNTYITADDLKKIDVEHSGRYRVAIRTEGVNVKDQLLPTAKEAANRNQRLFGFYGVGLGHLPFATADGGYDPAPGLLGVTERYSAADLNENPTLADMTEAALTTLEHRDRFWLMLEAGEVDWANHTNNIDNSIGAMLSGEKAFESVVRWVETHGGWKDTALIVTADHGHYLNLHKPEALIERK